MRLPPGCLRTVVPFTMISAATFAGGALGQVLPLPDPLLPEHLGAPLISQVPRSAPDATELAKYIRDRGAALKLGKALFWDMQIGSDGLTACATCHFHAGIDNRSKNQVSPGVLALVKDTSFASQLGNAPNRQLVLDDFPLHRLTDPNDRDSAVASDTNDVVSSQGVHYGIFVNATAGSGVDTVRPAPDPDGFQVGGINVRRVEPRNTPTVINAVFNKVLFWDGRAKATFNGIDPSGSGQHPALQSDRSGATLARVHRAPAIATRFAVGRTAAQHVRDVRCRSSFRRNRRQVHARSSAQEAQGAHAQQPASARHPPARQTGRASAGQRTRGGKPLAQPGVEDRDLRCLDPASVPARMVVVRPDDPDRRRGQSHRAGGYTHAQQPVHADGVELLALLRARAAGVHGDAGGWGHTVRPVPEGQSHGVDTAAGQRS